MITDAEFKDLVRVRDRIEDEDMLGAIRWVAGGGSAAEMIALLDTLQAAATESFHQEAMVAGAENALIEAKKKLRASSNSVGGILAELHRHFPVNPGMVDFILTPMVEGEEGDEVPGTK